MNSYERVFSVINLEEPDRPSMGEAINPPVFDKILGKKTAYWDLIRSSGKINDLINKRYLVSYGVCVTPKEYVHAQKKIGMDWILLVTGRPESSTTPEVTITEFKEESQTLWWVEGKVKTREDLEMLKEKMTPYDPGLVFNEVNKRAVALAHKLNMAVAGFILGPWQASQVACGLDFTLTSMYKQPALMREILEFLSWYNIEIGKQFIDLGVDFIIIGDDLADRKGPQISPKIFRESVFPLARKMVYGIQQMGVKVIWHTDGNVYPILKDLVDYVGIDGYHAIEPMAGMDIGVVKELYGDKISLFGNVDCSITLCIGKPEDVKRETLEVIKKAAYGGGLNVNSSNSIHNAVKLENFMTMIKTVHKYGKYPYK
ncbi:MAG: uroporphyrinogen decarboxylase family protein [Nitrososphaeria archaeon]